MATPGVSSRSASSVAASLALAALLLSTALPSVTGQPEDCSCACCMDDNCPTLTTHTFAAGSPEECNAQRCASNFFQCPDGGSHNEAAEVYATYFDCACECCMAEDTCAAGDYTVHKFFAGTTAACSAAACSSRFASCPDVGSHNDDLTVKFTYTGVDDSGADDSCKCSCCKGSQCDNGRTSHTFFAASASQCSEQACSSNFFQCPDPGAHNDEGEVYATYYDCKCACCDAESCPDYITNVFIAGSPDVCTPAQCSSRFASCPDSGSHNDATDVQAFYNADVMVQAGPEESGGGLSMPVVITISVLLVAAVAVAFGFAIYFIVKKRGGHIWVKEEEFNRMLDLTGNTSTANNAPKKPDEETDDV